MVHVCIAQYNENTDWCSNIKYPYTIISKEKLGINIGNEASTYLHYIIDNYDNLDDYIVFVHAHRTSYHMKGNTDDIINTLVFDKEYFNIADAPVYSVVGFPNGYKILKDCEEPIGQIIGVKIITEDVLYKTSGTFYVKRENILRHSKDVYKKLLEYIYSHPIPWYTGYAFEYTYHIIFTGDLVDHSY